MNRAVNKFESRRLIIQNTEVAMKVSFAHLTEAEIPTLSAQTREGFGAA